jgi:hypothetical protein
MTVSVVAVSGSNRSPTGCDGVAQAQSDTVTIAAKILLSFTCGLPMAGS